MSIQQNWLLPDASNLDRRAREILYSLDPSGDGHEPALHIAAMQLAVSEQIYAKLHALEVNITMAIHDETMRRQG